MAYSQPMDLRVDSNTMDMESYYKPSHAIMSFSQPNKSDMLSQSVTSPLDDGFSSHVLQVTFSVFIKRMLGILALPLSTFFHLNE